MQVEDIHLEDLVVGPRHVRNRFVRKNIHELVDSISKFGVLQPIIVQQSIITGKFEIITGIKRFQASQELGLLEIPAIVLEGPVDSETALAIGLSENVIREPLSRLDLIDACTMLYRKYGSIKDVFEATGLPVRMVNANVYFEQLCPELKEMVQQESVSVKAALQAQKVAENRSDPFDPALAILLAKQMESMPSTIQTRFLKMIKENPGEDVETVIERVTNRPQ